MYKILVNLMIKSRDGHDGAIDNSDVWRVIQGMTSPSDSLPPVSDFLLRKIDLETALSGSDGRHVLTHLTSARLRSILGGDRTKATVRVNSIPLSPEAVVVRNSLLHIHPFAYTFENAMRSANDMGFHVPKQELIFKLKSYYEPDDLFIMDSGNNIKLHIKERLSTKQSGIVINGVYHKLHSKQLEDIIDKLHMLKRHSRELNIPSY